MTDLETMPIPIDTPDNLTLDMELWDGFEQPMPSPAEVILNKYIAPGFVHDFVFYNRGTETPTLFCIWGALFAISCVIQRRAWLDWVVTRLYPNLYLLLVAKPGICKKTVSINRAAELVQGVRELHTIDAYREMFSIPLWHGAITPEFLFQQLTPMSVEHMAMDTGMLEPVKLGSRLAIIADELSVFLGKQKYNEGMIGRLIKLYDCPKRDLIGTKKDKTQVIENVFFNFVGGTQPDSFRETLSDSTTSSGLLSRMIICWQDTRTRSFPIPIRIPNCPSTSEMTNRLSWLSQNRMGQYALSDTAKEIYVDWYESNKGADTPDADARADILLVKTAMLIAMSRYEISQVITDNDILAAIELLDIASKHKARLEANMVKSDSWGGKFTIVSNKIHKEGIINRADLQRSVSWKINTEELNRILTSLAQSNMITVILDGQQKPWPSHSTNETYTWGNNGTTDNTGTPEYHSRAT